MTVPKSTDATLPLEAFTGPLKNQYHQALATLREAIELCPDDLWLDTGPTNAFWQVAYHALFFAHFYLGQNAASFRPWAEHQRDNQNEDGIAGDPDPKSTLPLIPRPYSKEQVLRYWATVDDMVDGAVDAMDLTRSESGFHYRMSKLEHQLVNLRHIQHHAAQLADRLRDALDIGVKWKGGSRPA
ncbi:MAG TPA: DinB family protein [Candidatus Eisenbacteria bacterium]|nr:DinB family protein [Candidatus Eisenbacteria bacterium]